jgi:hypothetical protein
VIERNAAESGSLPPSERLTRIHDFQARGERVLTPCFLQENRNLKRCSLCPTTASRNNGRQAGSKPPFPLPNSRWSRHDQ